MPKNMQESTYDLIDAGSGLNEASKNTERVLDRIKRKLKENTYLSYMLTSRLVGGLGKITRNVKSLMNPVRQLFKTLTIDGLIDGLEEYNNLIVTTRASVLATSRFYRDSFDAMAEATRNVSENIHELNTYADQTIYKFDQMTTAVNKFVQAGLKMDDATDIAMGLANILAYTGNVNPDTFQNVSLALSRAIQSGKMQLYQWRQFENAGIAGREISEMLYTVAGSMGKDVGNNFELEFGSLYDSNGKIRDDIEEGDFESFRDSIGDWLTSDVLAKAFKYLGKGENLTREEMLLDGMNEAAADMVYNLARNGAIQAKTLKTFSQLVDNVQEAAGTAWADVWMKLLGDANKAGKIWTTVGEKFTGEGSILKEMTEGLAKLNDVVDEDAVQDSIFLIADALQGWARSWLALLGINDFKSIGKAIGDFINVFAGKKDLDKNSKWFERIAKFLRDIVKQFTEGKPNVILRAIAGALRAIFNVVKELIGLVTAFVGQLFGGWDGFANAFRVVFDAIAIGLQKLKNSLNGLKGVDVGNIDKMDWFELIKTVIKLGGTLLAGGLIGKALTKFVNSFNPDAIGAVGKLFVGIAAMIAAIALLSLADILKVQSIMYALQDLFWTIAKSVLVIMAALKVIPLVTGIFAKAYNVMTDFGSGGSLFSLFGDKGVFMIMLGMLTVGIAAIVTAAKSIKDPKPVEDIIIVTVSSITILILALLKMTKDMKVKGNDVGIIMGIAAIVYGIASLIAIIAWMTTIVNPSGLGTVSWIMVEVISIIGIMVGFAKILTMNEISNKTVLALLILTAVIGTLAVVLTIFALISKIIDPTGILIVGVIIVILLGAVGLLILLAQSMTGVNAGTAATLAILAGVIAALAGAALIFALAGKLADWGAFARATAMLWELIAVTVLIGTLCAALMASEIGMAIIPLMMAFAGVILMLAGAVAIFALAGMAGKAAGSDGFQTVINGLLGLLAGLLRYWYGAYVITILALGLVALSASIMILIPSMLMAVPVFYLLSQALMQVGLAFATVGLGLAIFTNNKEWARMATEGINTISGAKATGFEKAFRTVFDATVNGTRGNNMTANALGGLEDTISSSMGGMSSQLEGMNGSMGNISDMLGSGMTMKNSSTAFGSFDILFNGTESTTTKTQDATPASPSKAVAEPSSGRGGRKHW